MLVSDLVVEAPEPLAAAGVASFQQTTQLALSHLAAEPEPPGERTPESHRRLALVGVVLLRAPGHLRGVVAGDLAGVALELVSTYP